MIREPCPYNKSISIHSQRYAVSPQLVAQTAGFNTLAALNLTPCTKIVNRPTLNPKLLARTYLTDCVYQVVLQKPILVHIRETILYCYQYEE